MGKEFDRLEKQRDGKENWRLWGPYLSERAWGTVREDYSPHGTSWEYLSHEQSRSRAYRWSEDGIGGISDDKQRLCLAFAFWNGKDPILKERLFGLTGNEGNHGEDVKESFFYTDGTPSHSLLRYLYKYPQKEYPYSLLVEENRRRPRSEPSFNLTDTGIFEEDLYWDIEITYVKVRTDSLFIRVTASNRGPGSAMLHLLPILWFRNTWSWGGNNSPMPLIEPAESGKSEWAVRASHAELGDYYLYGDHPAGFLFTENETNSERLFSSPNRTPYVKDAFQRIVVEGEQDSVNPDRKGTKFAAWHSIECEGGSSFSLDLVLNRGPLERPFAGVKKLLETREREAEEFFAELLPGASPEDALIHRQAVAGMIWSRQFYHYDVGRWLEGDEITPPGERRSGRNSRWRHLEAEDIISVPDKWEYPWFAAWDLAYHCMVYANFDSDFAKRQIELLLNWRYLHPNGQIPAYEWAFGDVNPPVHALAALDVFRTERKQRGSGDLVFLRRVFSKLLMNYMWWINRKDQEGLNVFEGGFMGLDNISVYDRSRELPSGYSLKQADSTGWMAMFALNMTVMALELAQDQPEFEDMAIQLYRQFLSIANSIAGHSQGGMSLWDPQAGFFKDIIITPDGGCHRIDVYSYVGLIPLLACEVIPASLIKDLPRFRSLLEKHRGGVFDGHIICACPFTENEDGERLLSLVDSTMIPHILKRLLDEDEFLSDHGIRSVSRIHADKMDLGTVPGIGSALIEYEPGESRSGLFGGNSNWRGPVWMPINYSILQSLEKFSRYLGPGFTVIAPTVGEGEVDLAEIIDSLCNRLVNIFRRGGNGLVPAFPEDSLFQKDPGWKDLRLFFEFFHGESGKGLGASHQTGWTGLTANLLGMIYGSRKLEGPGTGK